MQAANKISVFPCYTQKVQKMKQIQEFDKTSIIGRIRLDFGTKAQRLEQFKKSRLCTQ
jgi:hypothetical protein